MVTVRPARPGVDDLAALDTVAWHSKERRQAIAAWIADGRCVVAEREGLTVGYAVVTRDFFHLPFIEMLMVAETARRTGVGRALVLHCVAVAGGEKLFTSTNQSNAPMQALLADTGFVRSGIIENLDEGDPELIYVRLPAAG